MLRTIWLCILLVTLFGVVAVQPALGKKKGKSDGTPVTCGDVITAPGSYYLSGNCTGPGIQIAASNVKLKLKGYTMTGSPNLADIFGIYAKEVSNVTIEGPGTLRGYEVGVYFTYDVIGISRSKVEKVTSINNNYGAYWDGAIESELSECIMSNNLYGLFLSGLSRDNEVEENKFRNNDVGIFVDEGITGNEFEENSAFGNTWLDFEDRNLGCTANEWDDNRFNTSNDPCID
jgi:parallel beta-helix repeat protein